MPHERKDLFKRTETLDLILSARKQIGDSRESDGDSPACSRPPQREWEGSQSGASCFACWSAPTDSAGWADFQRAGQNLSIRSIQLAARCNGSSLLSCQQHAR